MLHLPTILMTDGRTPKSDAMSERRLGDTGIFYPEWFWEQGYRFADIMILVKKGRTEEVGREIFRKYNNVLVSSWRINSFANLVVQAYYKDSFQLKRMIEGMMALENVDKVEFSEYVQIVERRSYKEVEHDISIDNGA